MHLNKSTEQAVCIMLMLYLQNRKIYLNSKEISERLDISPTYLKKIMRKLVINKLIKANTGIGGGYRYYQNKVVSLYDIYVAINGKVELFVLQSDYISRIFKGAENIETRYHNYLNKIDSINNALIYSLKEITIDDIATDILKESSNIRLDWNNWQAEFKRIYEELNKK